MDHDSDAQLILAYHAGRREALEVLFGRYMKVVYRFVYRLAGDTHIADDVTQDAFVKAWKHLKKFDLTKNFKTWVLQIAKNTAFDYFKKKKAIPFSALDHAESNEAFIDTIADPAPLPPEFLARADVAQVLARALEKLSPASRATLLMHGQDDMTFREIAESMGEPLHTVKSRHRRAILTLRKLLIPE